jgi:hypothetical protein
LPCPSLEWAARRRSNLSTRLRRSPQTRIAALHIGRRTRRTASRRGGLPTAGRTDIASDGHARVCDPERSGARVRGASARLWRPGRSLTPFDNLTQRPPRRVGCGHVHPITSLGLRGSAVWFSRRKGCAAKHGAEVYAIVRIDAKFWHRSSRSSTDQGAGARALLQGVLASQIGFPDPVQLNSLPLRSGNFCGCAATTWLIRSLARRPRARRRPC